MGGRGSSSGRGVSGGHGGMKLPNGERVEFEGTLKYYGNDPNVTGKVRETIEAFEAKKGDAKVEWGLVVGPDGEPYAKAKRGSKGSVKLDFGSGNYEKAITSHIHPRETSDRTGVMLGGTFSLADMRSFAVREKTMRARAKEGTYSITKTKNFKSQEFIGYVNKVEREFRVNTSAALKKANDIIHHGDGKGQGHYQRAVKGYAKAFNTELVKMHEAYKQGEKKYGYVYTLERNK